MATSVASRNGVGCQPLSRQELYSVVMVWPREGQAIFRAAVVMLSLPGVLLFAFAMALKVSHPEIVGQGSRGV